ncbi:MAG: class I SAM-dependent methyltransferase [Acidobacteriota bacterium]
MDLFDLRYALVDQIRKPRRVAAMQARSISRLTGINPPGPVIDFACGYGRHCLAFAREGFLVHGVDQSAELLSEALRRAAAARKQVTLTLADLRTWRWPPREYRLAVCLDTSWGYFADHDENMSVLEGAFRVLEPGGYFILEQVNFGARQVRWRLNEERGLADHLRYRKRSKIVEDGHVWVGSYEYESGSEVTQLPFKIRLYTAEELASMLVQVGFDKGDICVLGSWSGNAFHAARSSAAILMARKSAVGRSHGSRGGGRERRPPVSRV